jgi:glycosyltransferase involved in cell wall biosynthesis
MRVLQVIDSLALGGAEVLVSSLYPGFRQRGIECEYYLLRALGTNLEQELLGQGAHLHAPCSASVYSPLHILSLANHLRSRPYDLVHVHLFPAQLWAACGAQVARLHTPIIATEHSTQARRRRRWYRFVDHWMYRQYKAVASVSAAASASLAAWLPEVGNKTFECPNGIDIDAFALATTPGKQALFSLREDTPVIMCVGSLEYAKGHETLLRAVSLIPDAVLVLVGVGTLSEKLQSLAQELGIASRVRFLGIRVDVAQLLKAADIYVQPSRWESFGIAALEAMAAGKPIVASNIPGLKDVVGDSGLLVPPGDSDRLAQAIVSLLGDSTSRQRLALAAQIRARTFGLNSTLDCYERLYREVVKTVAT